MPIQSFDVVASGGTYYASITRQHPAADGFNPLRPWLLVHGDGRVHKAASLRVIRAEAFHAYPAACIRRA